MDTDQKGHLRDRYPRLWKVLQSSIILVRVCFERYRVIFQNGSARHVYLVDEPDGWKIDWDIYARTGEAPMPVVPSNSGPNP